MRKIIVGVDPGTTTAVAVLDIDSGFYDVASRKNFSLSAALDYIVNSGDPLIIATDKKSVPGFAQKIAATFGARISKPEENLGAEQKEQLTRRFFYENDHEQDALAAAEHAKKQFSPFFEKIEHALEKRGFEGRHGDVKELLLKGEAGNIEQALKLLAPAEMKDTKIIMKLVDSRSILELRRRHEQLQKENAALKGRIAEMEQRIIDLQQKLEEEHELRRKIAATIARPKIAVEKETLPAELERDYYIVVEYEPGADVTGKIIIVDKGADIAAVAKKEPRAIIAETFPKSFIKREDVDIPIIARDSLAIKNVHGFLVAEKAAVDGAIKKSFISWLRDYRNRHEKN